MIDNALYDTEEYLRQAILASEDERLKNVSCPAPTGNLQAGSILIEQTGGERQTFVSDMHFYQVEVWHDTTEKAFDVANACASLITSTYNPLWYGLPQVITLPHFSTTSRSGGRIKSTNPEKANRMFCYIFNVSIHIRRKD